MDPQVEITSSGRGGSIHYREDAREVRFDWEFAGGDALALIFGTKAAQWNARYPWAIGRQGAIFDQVARAAVEQKAAGRRYKIDLENGDITIY